ncbi:MAG: DUF4198 domain-containing protein [Myxococcota bacterium]
MRWFLIVLGASIVGLPARLALAHDFWIEPSSFAIEPGLEISVRLKVGHEDDVKEWERKPERIVRLDAQSPGKAPPRPILGNEGDKPAGRVTLHEPGAHQLVYRSRHSYIEMPAEKFNAYLDHEGLKAPRRARGETKEDGLESYARYCKALVRVGDGYEGASRRVGLALEFMPLQDRFDQSETLEFVLEFRGKPLVGARVDLLRLDDLTRSFHTITDNKGVVRFKNPGAGRWMVATTHMIAASAEIRGDWESFWSTLSFLL